MLRKHPQCVALAVLLAVIIVMAGPLCGQVGVPATSAIEQAVLSDEAKGLQQVVATIQHDFADFLSTHPAFKNSMGKAGASAQAVLNGIAQDKDGAKVQVLADAFYAAVADMQKRADGFANDTRQKSEVRNTCKAISDLIKQLNIPASAKINTPAIASSPASSAAAGAVSNPLRTEQLQALVFVEGDKSSGTGFIVRIKGKFFIVTNLHVLSGNSKITITGMDGAKYPTNGDLYAAQDEDVAILSIPDAKNELVLIDDAVANVQVNDVVTVPGNAEGAEVATQVNGKVLGIGPNLVEVDAKFVQGNSGSPIIQRSTSKVIGVATYATIYKLDNLKAAANLRSVRWFGYRLDNVKDWQRLDWAKFSKDGQALLQIEDMTDWFITLLRTGLPTMIDNSKLNDATDQYLAAMRLAAKDNSTKEETAAVDQYVASLKAISNDNLRLLASAKLYDYHAKQYKDQQDARDSIVKALQESLNYSKLLSASLP